MAFLTQGKTNWKYILIVLILAVIVGGAILDCYSKFPGTEFSAIKPPKTEKEISVTTDKTEYEQGEEINATLKYEGEIYQWGNYGWSIQKLENDTWITIQKRGDLYFFCANTPECKDINLDEIEECPPVVLCERPMWYKVQEMPKEMLRFSWDQSYKAEEKTFQCKTGKPERVETWSCVIFDQTLPGKYKVRFEYALSINPDDPFGRNVDIKYAEKEFTVKEKRVSTETQCEFNEMIFYYYEKCGWCQKVKNEGTISKIEDLGVKVAQVDVKLEPVQHEFSGVPTFVINETVYSGYRTFEQLKELLGC